MDSDLFGDSNSSIFGDIPSSSPREKKKKKESSLFADQGEGTGYRLFRPCLAQETQTNRI